MRFLFALSIAAVSLVAFATLAGFTDPAAVYRTAASLKMGQARLDSDLAHAALDKVLGNALPIFGAYKNTQSATSTWMKAYDDKTPVTQMNIPGTHDTATWNFSQTTQQSLVPITDLIQPGADVDPTFFRCQQRPIIDMLDAGIRAFDLRYAMDVTNSTLVFWHGRALQSQTATVGDVLFGYFRWLDDHPSEAIFLSLKFEGNDLMRNVETARVQEQIYSILTSPVASKYVVQQKDRFGTLGDARGKVTLLRRFDLDLVDPTYESRIPGVHFSPQKWTNNGANISLVYDEATGATAYIQDYYHPLTQHGSSIADNIEVKYDAVTTHLSWAAQASSDVLVWSFASSTKTDNEPPNTPRLQALGDADSPGVNQRLVPFLQSMQGKRLGIVLFDFFDEPNDLVQLFLSLLGPNEALAYRH